MVVLVLVWVACGFVGWKIGESKGRAGLGLVLGILLGLIGLVIIAFMRPAASRADAFFTTRVRDVAPAASPVQLMVRCPSCKASIPPAASVCPKCRHAVQPSALLPPPQGTPARMLGDPSGRFVNRYWDGSVWTEWVQNDSKEYLTDPPVPSRRIG